MRSWCRNMEKRYGTTKLSSHQSSTCDEQDSGENHWKRIQQQTDEYDILLEEQFGLRYQHSSKQQVLRLVEYATDRPSRKLTTCVIFLGVAKAFDRVWHEALINKTDRVGCPKNIVLLPTSNLKAREFWVRIGNELSICRRPAAGLPQGAMVSP